MKNSARGGQLWAGVDCNESVEGHKHQKGKELAVAWGSVRTDVAPRSTACSRLYVHLCLISLAYREHRAKYMPGSLRPVHALICCLLLCSSLGG